jgi:hypothetical protein
MEATCASEMPLDVQQTTRCYIPEDRTQFIWYPSIQNSHATSRHFRENLLCICSPTAWWFSQSSLAVLPVILPHALHYGTGWLDF